MNFLPRHPLKRRNFPIQLTIVSPRLDLPDEPSIWLRRSGLNKASQCELHFHRPESNQSLQNRGCSSPQKLPANPESASPSPKGQKSWVAEQVVILLQLQPLPP